MEMKGERPLAASCTRAFAALNDVELLARAVPGCESLVASGENTFEVVVNAAIGPVKAKFKGRMTLSDIEPPERYTIRFEAQGGQAGFARGDARVELVEQTANSSVLHYAVKAQVGGRLAQVGSRLVDAAAAAMADQFFDAFSAQLGSAAEAEPPPPVKLGFWKLLVAFLRRLFGGSAG